MNKRHFYTFDALRFLAFFKVFLLHIPLIAFPIYNYLKSGGGIGVSFFFVLSGFLITYILLEEKERTGTINLKYFYLKRILRIWPLFYLMILFAFITPYILSFIGISGSGEGYEPNWFLSILFLENYQIMFHGMAPNVSPLGVMWSVCVEEHYYVIWGALLYFIDKKYIPVLLIVSVIIANITRFWYLQLGLDFLDLFSNLDFFAYGASPAYVLISKKEHLLRPITGLPDFFKWFILVVTVVSVFVIPNLQVDSRVYWEQTYLGVLFSMCLIILIPGVPPFKLEDSHLLSKLGHYTYGLYLYHGIVINLFIQIYRRLNYSLDNIYNAWFFFVITLLVSIIISILSYHLYEVWFLRLKQRLNGFRREAFFKNA